jgi:Cu(I)/Ag(I) efflux system protein CusF
MIRRHIFLTLVAIAAATAAAAPTLASDTVQATERVPSFGRVVKVEANAGTITVEHKPIWHLYMEAMTMTFRIKDPSMLVGLTHGDKIRFRAERDKEGPIITWIEHSN